MAGERINRGQVNKGVAALLSTKRGENGKPRFPLHSVSYYHSEQSSIHRDPRFMDLVAEFGPIVQDALLWVPTRKEQL